jgi:glycosyltransferase involved in cell wall biosynthesis
LDPAFSSPRILEEKMKIALIHYTAPPVVGGVETVLARQAQQLQRGGHQVTVLAGRGEAWDARIPVQVIPRMDSRHPQILKTKAFLDAGQVPQSFAGLVDELERDLRRGLAGVDVVIAHNVASLHKNLALTAVLHRISQSPGAPRFILWHHDLAWGADRYEGELHSGYPWDLLRTPWPGVRQVVVSEARRTELAGLLGLDVDEIQAIPAGLDLAAFLDLPPHLTALLDRLNLAGSAPILLSPVRLTRRKNLELALTTLAALRQWMPEAALVITGPPGAHNPSNTDYMSQLLRLRAELNLEKHAHLMAEYAPDGLPEADVSALYRLADALFLPSREEGFGIPILEAALAHLPIFCSSLAALRALAGDSAVYFSPDDTPLTVAAQVRDYLQTDPVYALRARVRLNYTWEAVYRKQIEPMLVP